MVMYENNKEGENGMVTAKTFISSLKGLHFDPTFLINYSISEKKEDDFKFDFEVDFEHNEEGMDDMDKNGDICKFFLNGRCTKGNTCTFRHSRGEKAVVCKHWLRGLCKKGPSCEFLHEYDLNKMPPCFFFTKYGECSNAECMYRHINPEEQQKECAWYARGFCKHGPKCHHKHVKKIACAHYMAGFCPKGPSCPYGHAKFELPKEENQSNDGRNKTGQSNVGGGGDNYNIGNQQRDGQSRSGNSQNITCHKCGATGHKAMNCPNQNQSHQMNISRGDHKGDGGGGQMGFDHQMGGGQSGGGGKAARPLHTVTCYKCGQTGHYANKCTAKGGFSNLYNPHLQKGSQPSSSSPQTTPQNYPQNNPSGGNYQNYNQNNQNNPQNYGNYNQNNQNNYNQQGGGGNQNYNQGGNNYNQNNYNQQSNFNSQNQGANYNQNYNNNQQNNYNQNNYNQQSGGGNQNYNQGNYAQPYHPYQRPQNNNQNNYNNPGGY